MQPIIVELAAQPYVGRRESVTMTDFARVADHLPGMFAALRPGGRLVAQCGGKGNIERFHAVLHELAEEPPFAEYIGGWTGPWNFADPPSTALRLEAAGFEDVSSWLHPAPVVPDEAEAFIGTVCLGHHLERLPEDLRPLLVERMIERAPSPLTLDYVRLNIDARRPE